VKQKLFNVTIVSLWFAGLALGSEILPFNPDTAIVLNQPYLLSGEGNGRTCGAAEDDALNQQLAMQADVFHAACSKLGGHFVEDEAVLGPCRKVGCDNSRDVTATQVVNCQKF